MFNKNWYNLHNDGKLYSAYRNDTRADCHSNSCSHCSKINGASILFWKKYISYMTVRETNSWFNLQFILLHSFYHVFQNHYFKPTDQRAVCLNRWSYTSWCVSLSYILGRYGGIINIPEYKLLSTAFLILSLFNLSSAAKGC